MIGKNILHYKILEKLGEGGMGVVYKAEDTKLDRTVAIKFLPRNIAANQEEKQRFVIEAKAAAALNHPNIATIFNIEEADDEMFIVMEYIDGQELKEIIKSEIPNPKSAIDYATQIAEGLQAAHKKGIVHRDIKSSNIMITNDGKIKIMDFGLAKVQGSQLITKAGTTIGTIAYMSPEQSRGTPTDHRTDIWSFGVVLYEMLTGQLPFKGEYDQAIIYSILNEKPESISTSNKEVPENIEKIVHKALAKNPDERYQSMTEILADLRFKKDDPSTKPAFPTVARQTSPKKLFPYIPVVILLILAVLYFISNSRNDDSTISARQTVKRMAVLPFTSLKNDPDSDFLGFALADQIINALSYINNVLVRPSSEIRKYINQTIDSRTAAKELNVDYLLTGNYLKELNQVRLNVELVNANSKEMIWGESINVKFESTFTLQDIVTEKVVRGLKLQFSDDSTHQKQLNAPKNSLAYEYYLRSIAIPNSNEGAERAIDILNKSIQLDSSYAPAYSELGMRYIRLSEHGSEGRQAWNKAEQALLKALSLNENQLNTLTNLSLIYTDVGRTAEAIQLARRALKINNNYSRAHMGLGYAYRYAGMLEESEKEYDTALAIDPNNPQLRSAGLTYMYLQEYQKALKAFDMDPDSPFNFYHKGEIYLRMNQPEEAIKYFDRVISMPGEIVLSLSASALKGYIKGDFQQALQNVRKLEEVNPADAEVWYDISHYYGLLGDEKGCARAMEKAIELGFFNYPLMRTDKFYDPVRASSEFQKALQKAKEKHEAFKIKYSPEV